MTCKELLIEALQKAGFNGLGHDFDCCCTIDDLIPCNEDPSGCEPCNLTKIDEGSFSYDYEFDYNPKVKNDKI